MSSALRRSYRDALARFGTLTLTRPAGGATVTAVARVMDYEPHEIAGPIQAGDRKALVLAEDCEAAGFVPAKNDTVMLGTGRAGKVLAVDDHSRRVDGALLAYVLQIRGW